VPLIAYLLVSYRRPASVNGNERGHWLCLVICVLSLMLEWLRYHWFTNPSWKFYIGAGTSWSRVSGKCKQ